MTSTEFSADTTSMTQTASGITTLAGNSGSTAGELGGLVVDVLSFAQIGAEVGAANTSLQTTLEQALSKISTLLGDIGKLVGTSAQGYAADDTAIAQSLGGNPTPAPAPAPTVGTDGDKYVDDFIVAHHQGDTGVRVRQFQNELKQLGYDPGTADGQWGPDTQKAVDAYTAAHHYTTGLSGTSIDLPGQLGVVQAPNEQAATAVRSALSQTGVTYVYGGKAHDSALDCSGLTRYAYQQAGIDLPEKSTAQTVGAPVARADLAPGDLVVWDGHVAMYIGQDKMVEAPHTGEHVHISDLRTTTGHDKFLGFYRPSVPSP